MIVFAQEIEGEVAGLNNGTLTLIGWVAVGAIVGCLLARFWLGICNHVLIDHESISSIQKRQPYFPRARMMIGTVLATGAVFIFSLRVLGDVAPFASIQNSTLLLWFLIVGTVAVFFQMKFKSSRDYIFAILVGTVLAFGLLGLTRALLHTDMHQDPFIMALGIVCAIVLWRFLFGPWSPRIKAVVLGSFIIWIGVHVLFKEAPDERMAHLIASGVALIPAFIWCWFFLEYHKQRWSMVLLMFFAGMLSTAPILFYDSLVRRGVELQFFLFKIVPQNFSSVSNAFVAGDLMDVSGVQSTILATFISFIIVGLIEESSKFWVLKKSGKPFFSSIDDVIQMAVIVAIGFAFAENVLNPTYFLGFVREFLTESSEPQWWAFIGNVSGRAILTTMVHIVASGVMGYFFGLAIFAESYLDDTHRKGHVPIVAGLLRIVFRLPEKKVFRVHMILLGLTLATVIHGLFNFMVTLPDMLPGNPETFGDLLRLSESNFLSSIPLLLLPSFLYIVGGFWLFTVLFYRQESVKERGRLVTTDTFVRGKMAGA
ncbi:MAG: PrsW family intramembrane metalloprotease [Kiritimatiellales bacterium]|nr:PrsW family intramembrane metalloprotease [Kiritimatiellales bacterium]